MAALVLAVGIAPAADTRDAVAPFLTPITARFEPERRATVYTAQLKDPSGNPLGGTYSWKLTPATDDPACDELRVSADNPREATWFHADSDGCTHRGTDHAGAVIEVTVTYRTYTCVAVYEGSATGTGPEPAACKGSEPPSCKDELIAVAKAKELVSYLKGRIEQAKKARKDASIDVVYARGVITGIESEPPSVFDKVVGADVYLGRLLQAEQELARAQKALSDVTKELSELQQQLLAAQDALAKAQKAVDDCRRQRRSIAGAGGTTACEAQATALEVARVRATAAAKAHKSLWSPTARARRAVRAALVDLGNPPQGLPSSLRTKHSVAVSRTKEAETALSRLLAGLDAGLASARRASTAAAAKLKACQKP